MRRHRIMMVLAGAAAVCCAAPLAVTAAPPARAAAQTGTWGTAIQVPGMRSLNQGGQAEVRSVSCGSAGNCVAGGYYRDGSGQAQGFVVSERSGKWRTAIEVPGLGVLNASRPDGGAGVNSVSCPSAGNCAAVGPYIDSLGNHQVFVASQVHGTWDNAIEVPGFGTLNKHGFVGLGSVSCASAGNCAAVGGYLDGSFRSQVFVVSERNGTWGNAIKVPGTGILNAGGSAAVFSVSCATAGNCAAGGTYRDALGHQQAFVVSQVNGTWGKAIEVPGSGTLNAGGDASVSSVSCGSAGNCTAVGGYRDGFGHLQAFVVREANGTWRGAFKVPGSGALNWGGLAYADSVSCASAGNCAVGGSYTDGAGQAQAFVASETNGTFRKAIEVLGSGTLNAGRFGSGALVSCASAGNCAAGLTYTDDVGVQQAFVVSQTNGTWGNAIEIPGLASLNVGGNAVVNSVSCGSAGNCAAGGSYRDRAGHTHPFVVSQA
jgi:hypothetical protein